MNIHPVIVHFPIALLTVYAVFELLHFKKLNQNEHWFYVKAILVIAGTIGAFIAFGTGDIAKHVVISGSDGNVHQIQNLRQVINAHKNFAALATFVFAIISGCYIIAWLNLVGFSRFLRTVALQKIWELVTAIEKFFIQSWFAIIMALVGLVLILGTGALGGLIVYGPNEDIATHLAYQLLGGQQSGQQQQNPGSASNTLTYKNLNYNFEFQYPKDWGFVQPSYYNLQEPIVQVATPRGAYPNTNFGDAGFAVSWSNATSLQDCLSQNPPDTGPATSGQKPFSQTAQINGTTFYTVQGTGAGAGNYYESRVYRYYQQKFCFEVTETIHTSNIYNYTPGTVSQINTAPIWDQLDQILNTFKFDQAQQ